MQTVNELSHMCARIEGQDGAEHIKRTGKIANKLARRSVERIERNEDVRRGNGLNSCVCH